MAGLAILQEPGAAAAAEAHRLAPSDRITVTVFRQPEPSGDAVINQAGTISITLTVPIEQGPHVSRLRAGASQGQGLIPIHQWIEKQLALSR